MYLWNKKNFSNKFLLTFFIVLWLLMLVCAIFYLRSAQVRINEVILNDFQFSQIKLPPFIKVSLDYVCTKDIYAPWLYSEMLFGIVLTILLLVSPILIYHRFIKRKSLFNIKNKKIIFTLIICFSLLIFANGLFGILTYQWKYQWYNKINPAISRLDLFLSTQPSWIVNIANKLIPSSFSQMFNKSYLDLFSYTYATLLFGCFAIVLSILMPIFLLLKNNNKLSNKFVKSYQWIIYFSTLCFISIIIVFYLINFVNDCISSSEQSNIWNTSSSYSVSTLLISICLFFSLLFYSYIFINQKLKKSFNY